MHSSSLPKPTYAPPTALARLVSAQTDLTIVVDDVFGKEHTIYAQTGDDGRVRVVTVQMDGRLELSPDALGELAALVGRIKVEVKS